ncbi:VWA domain-containing protein [Roseibacillus ishigakijimensis]|uniref:VWA domain-containing protein n=1 Tax=Roseibacillus ishigakijimensis TaxID=454146 RepID=A0A934VL72_9BACT|nr:VWA domain-containing protein [Roseibacillus ishigakijimensis]MBK1834379.1 VWA domain-containing protein [Roseibacillus ishigakijimensis]
MKFAEPAFFFLLLLVPLLALGAWLAERQRREAWQKLVAPRLRKKLVAPASPYGRWLSLACGLLGFLFLILALAQPNAGEREVTSQVRGRNIIIALDVSRSMLVRDVAPDRLQATKTAVYEFLDRFPEERIGLLAFAGTAALQAPLTVDHNALRETLDQLDENNVPSGGSNLADAINLATQTFKETGQRTHGLIVFSDGELHEGELADAAFDAREAGVFVVTIGMGTREGDFVPDGEESDGRFRDREGRPVLSRLTPEPLQELAADTGGLYLEGIQNNFTESIDTVISRLDAFEDEGRVQRKPVPRFQWFLITAMLFFTASILLRYLWPPARPAMVSARPVLTALTAFLLVGLTPRAEAWSNPLEGFLGTQALRKGESKTAREHFRKAAEESAGEERARAYFGQGLSDYQSKAFTKAAEAFGEALLSENQTLQRDAHSHLGNTLYQRAYEQLQTDPSQLETPISLLEDALAHYDSALTLDNEHEFARTRRDIAAQALEILQKQQEQQQQEQQDQEEQEEDGEGENGEEEPEEGDNEGEEGENGDNDEEGQDGEGGEGEDPQEGENGSEGDDEKGEGANDRPEGQQDRPGTPGEAPEMRPAPREGESGEEFARRILEENADIQQEALRKHGRQFTPNKDW